MLLSDVLQNDTSVATTWTPTRLQGWILLYCQQQSLRQKAGLEQGREAEIHRAADGATADKRSHTNHSEQQQQAEAISPG